MHTEDLAEGMRPTERLRGVFGAAAPLAAGVVEWDSRDLVADPRRDGSGRHLARRVVAIAVSSGPVSRAVVRAFRAAGADVALLVERSRATARSAPRRAPRRGDSLRVHVDSGDPRSCRRAIGEVVAAFGPIDALVLCESRGGAADSPRRRARPLALSSVAAAAMRHGGSLIVASRGASPPDSIVVETTRAWADALSRFGLRVNAVDAGPATLAEADEAARCCVYLACPESYPASGRTYRIGACERSLVPA